jgi:peptidoglycan/xylan/chitin deacetylase (PgdA/CDA1 family)
MPTPKRDRLVNGFDRLGLLWALKTFARRPGLLVLAYHRIGEPAGQPFDDELISASAQGFREQLLYLRSRFDVIGLDELIARLGSAGPPFRRPTAMITFDDGYRDNYEVALPILRDVRLPAVFFIAAGYIDRARLTWWDRVAYVVKSTTRATLKLDYPEPLTIDLRQPDRNRAAQQILRAYKRMQAIDQEQFFDHLEEQAGVEVDCEALGRDLFMSWDQVRGLRDSGMAIGSHTYNHPVLAQMPEAIQLSELTRSKQALESEVDRPIHAIAYPVGAPESFNESTKTLAREAGYRAAFSYNGGFNRPGELDTFDLRRLAVNWYDSSQMFRFRVTMSNLVGRGVL